MGNSTKRVTVYFDAKLQRALRLKAAAAHQSLSAIVNEAVRRALAEDAEDLAAFEERAKEPNLALEGVLSAQKRHVGHIKRGLRQAQAGKLASEKDVAKALGLRRR